MAYLKYGCADCGEYAFVTNCREGDVTCTSCGLVQEECMLMEDIYYNQNQDVAMLSDTKTESNVTLPTTIERLFDTSILAFGLDETSEILQASKDMFRDVKEQYMFKGARATAVVACCVYIAFKLANRKRVARDASEVCKQLGIETSLFAKCMKDVVSLLPKIGAKLQQVTEDDSIIRQIQMVQQIPHEMIYKLTTVVRHLDQKRIERNLMMGTAPMITNAVLIFVGAKRLDIKLKKTQFLTYGWVSRATLDKHMKDIVKIS